MKVTICQLPDESDEFRDAWDALVSHVHDNKSELVLLPEMPFSPWFALRDNFTSSQWNVAVQDHDIWLEKLTELSPATVLSSRPVNHSNGRLNEGFIWNQNNGYQPVHHKYFLPNEWGFWEASWYDHGPGDFTPYRFNNASIGFQICTELWSLDTSRAYGEAGVNLIVNPRATEVATNDKWLVGGRAASLVSGAFCLSSNRYGSPEDVVHFGGAGWITGPDGEILATTSSNKPFITLDIDISMADKAKSTYPRYTIHS